MVPLKFVDLFSVLGSTTLQFLHFVGKSETSFLDCIHNNIRNSWAPVNKASSYKSSFRTKIAIDHDLLDEVNTVSFFILHKLTSNFHMVAFLEAFTEIKLIFQDNVCAAFFELLLKV